MTANKGTCALCRLPAQLRRSHILPKFTQRRLKQNGARILRKNSATAPVVPVQDFACESLLCAECETRISRWEDCAARVFNQSRKLDLPPLPQGQGYVIKDLDYHRLKLYLLSLLWRMGVSSLPEFRHVCLGSHEERIRRMLLSNDPGNANDYGCTLDVVTDCGTRIPVTWGPDRHRFDALTVRYRLLVDGFLLSWAVGSDSVRGRVPLNEFFLQEDGTWWVVANRHVDIAFLSEALAPIFRTRRS